MELKAENDFTVTEELFREGMGQLQKDEYYPAMRKMLIAMAVILVVLAAVTVRFGGRLFAIGIEALVVSLVCVWMAFISPKRRMNAAWEAFCKQADLSRNTRFYEDRLEVTQGSLIVNYENVLRVSETENMILLISDEGAAVMVAKNGFTVGDWDTVKGLLDEWKR